MKENTHIFGGRARRLVVLAFMVLCTAAVTRAGSVTFIGDFSNMTVGEKRPVRAQVYGALFGDKVTLDNWTDQGFCYNGVNLIGFSLTLEGQYTCRLTDIPLPIDAFGNGITQTIFIKALAPTPEVYLNGCTTISITCGNIGVGISATNSPPNPTPTPTPVPSATPTIYIRETGADYLAVGCHKTLHIEVHNGKPNFAGNIKINTEWVNTGGTIGPSYLGLSQYPGAATVLNEYWVPIKLDPTGNGNSDQFRIRGLKASSNSHVVYAKYDDGSRSTTSQYNVTVVNVERVWFERNSGEVPLDTEPRPEAGGLRIYPEKKTPTDSSFGRDKVIVRAKIFPAVAGLKIDFRIFDVDDPTVTSPADPTGQTDVDPNGVAGNDNRGPTSIYPVGASTTTNAAGEAFTYIQVSPQPGDNIRVAAAVNASFTASPNPRLDDVGMSGTNLYYINGGAILQSEGGVTEQVVATPLLTTWRKVHIERDSMGLVTGNSITRKVTGVTTANGYTAVALDGAPMPIGRFGGGRMTLAPPRGLAPQSVNIVFSAAQAVLVTETLTPSVIGYNAILVDDDDMNANDGANKHGDIGEDVPMPDTRWMEDVPGSFGNGGQNGFFAACIRPTYDLQVNDDSLPFVANLPKADPTSYMPTDEETATIEKFDNIGTRADMDFWTVYLIAAYQPPQDVDQDPDGDYLANGFWNSYVGFSGEFTGAVCFVESNSEAALHDSSWWDPYSSNYSVWFDPRDTPLHEVAHMLGAKHGDGGRIDGVIGFGWSGKTLDHMRRVTYPKPL